MRGAMVATLTFLAASTAVCENGPVTLVAVTESGAQIPFAEYDPGVKKVGIVLRDAGIGMDDRVVDILNVELLERLEVIDFFLVPQIKRYEFLRRVPWVRAVWFWSSRLDSLDFLDGLPNLVAFGAQECRGTEGGPVLEPMDLVDLSHNPQLEFFGLEFCSLEALPRFSGVPDSLRYVDISGNPIELGLSDLLVLHRLGAVEAVFAHGVRVPEYISAQFGFFVFDHSGGHVPDYWAVQDE